MGFVSEIRLEQQNSASLDQQNASSEAEMSMKKTQWNEKYGVKSIVETWEIRWQLCLSSEIRLDCEGLMLW